MGRCQGPDRAQRTVNDDNVASHRARRSRHSRRRTPRRLRRELRARLPHRRGRVGLSAHGALSASVLLRLRTLGWNRGERDGRVLASGGLGLAVALVFVWFAGGPAVRADGRAPHARCDPRRKARGPLRGRTRQQPPRTGSVRCAGARFLSVVHVRTIKRSLGLGLGGPSDACPSSSAATR